MSSLASLLTDTAARYGDRPALKLDDVELSYAAFDEAAARWRDSCASAASRQATASGSWRPTSRSSPSSTTGSCARAASWRR